MYVFRFQMKYVLLIFFVLFRVTDLTKTTNGVRVVQIYDGEATVLVCKFQTKNEEAYNIKWLKNGTSLNDLQKNERISIENYEAGKSLFIIKKTLKHDAGLYSCETSSNPVKAQTIQLNVCENINQFNASESTIKWAKKGIGSNEYQDIIANEGEEVKLNCTQSRTENLQIRWFFRISKEISSPTEIGMFNLIKENDIKSFMIIKRAKRTNAGVYVCEITDKDIRIKIFNLKINDSKKNDSKKIVKRITKRNVRVKDEPYFAELVPNITVIEGREAILPCVVENLDRFKIAWLNVERKQVLTIHKNVITRNYRVTMENRDPRHWILHIKDVKSSDRGHYMCQINTRPMKHQTGYLQVVVPPKIDEHRTVSDAVALEGTDVVLKCYAAGYPEPTITWRREDGKEIRKRDEYGNMIKEAEAVGSELLIIKVSRIDMGAFMCIASNGVAPSMSRRILLQVNFPPMLWIPHQQIRAKLGSIALLECYCEAYPKSINYWKNSSEEMITSDDHYSISMIEKSSFKTHMILQILNVRKSDFGVYKCVSQNPLGGTEGHITLQQEKSDEVHQGYNSVENAPQMNGQNIIILDKENAVKEQLVNKNSRENKILKTAQNEGKLLPTRTDLSKHDGGSSGMKAKSSITFQLYFAVTILHRIIEKSYVQLI